MSPPSESIVATSDIGNASTSTLKRQRRIGDNPAFKRVKVSTGNESASLCTLERELGRDEKEKSNDDDNVDDYKEEERRRRRLGILPTQPLICHHRQELLHLLEKFLSFHQWKDAAGIISCLFSSSPRKTISGRQLQRMFMAACEIQQQLGDANNFHKEVGQIFDGYIEQMLSPEMIARAKLDVAHFYFSQGEYEEANQNVQNVQITLQDNLVQDIDGKGNPFVNLLLGLICYERWYRNSIPEDMKVQGCNYSDTRDVSQSDVATGFGSPISPTSLEDPSVFHVHGLDMQLLPIRLRPMHEDLEDSIQEYRQLSKDVMYEQGVRGLKNALHSFPPQAASLDALVPLIQLLLLGDHVTEAATELRFSCSRLNYSPVPFGLRAKFLECFAPQELDVISSCYEAAVKMDATCSSYVEGLIRIHSNRNDYHSMKVLLEMIPRHIDVVPSGVLVGQHGIVSIGREVKTSVWEGLASCFLKVSNIIQVNMSSKILSERVARAIWKMRFRSWKEKHFREICLFSQAHSRMSEHPSISGSSNVGSDLNNPSEFSWEDHYEPDPYDKNAASCNYCNMSVKGKLQMKEHLIGKEGFFKACNRAPQHVRMKPNLLLKDKDREKEQHSLSFLHLLPGDDELLARKAACACHLYGPNDEYVVEILKFLTLHGLNDYNSFLQTHMDSALNLRSLLG